MNKYIRYLSLACCMCSCHLLVAQQSSNIQGEEYRPQIHFTPEKNWVNDPNGMVYHKGVYHLFFQHSPDKSVWNEISWGHATSKDLVHWKRQPMAIKPDSLGLIFSGSAVVDKNNTSGFGTKNQTPLVAIFTQHNMQQEKLGANNYENQSIAYSLNDGKSWTMYKGNPVIKNPGIRDFRDPKVFWHEGSKQWIMSLAVTDHISFYASTNLKDWKKLSDFGASVGAHGGVWECPDLFSLNYKGKTFWVLLVNLNPGGPNKGSATQYFVGEFDGTTFVPVSTNTKWLDYGPDEYAGVIWNNTGNRRILIGWMSNWMYANIVPTEKWRNGMTLPRELSIDTYNNEYIVTSNPVKELNSLAIRPVSLNNKTINGSLDLKTVTGKVNNPCNLQLSFDKSTDLTVEFSNDLGELVTIGYNKTANQFFLNRTQSGKVAFHKEFASINYAPRLSNNDTVSMNIYLDKSSVELFSDGGKSVLTGLIFPNKEINAITLKSTNKAIISKGLYTPLQSIWK